MKLVVENCEENPDFGAEIIEKMVELLDKITPTDFIIKAAVWIFGEIGSNNSFIADQDVVFQHLTRLLDN